MVCGHFGIPFNICVFFFQWFQSCYAPISRVCPELTYSSSHKVIVKVPLPVTLTVPECNQNEAGRPGRLVRSSDQRRHWRVTSRVRSPVTSQVTYSGHVVVIPSVRQHVPASPWSEMCHSPAAKRTWTKVRQRSNKSSFKHGILAVQLPLGDKDQTEAKPKVKVK